MREVVNLSGDNGGLTPDCAAILMAYMTFPDCPASRYQSVTLLRLEKERYLLDKAGYSYSELTRSLLKVRIASEAQRSVTGLTFMAFPYLSSKGKECCSPYAAQLLVEKSLKAAKTNGPPLVKANFADGEWSVEGMRYPGTQKEIRKAYKRFESVGHIIAAEMMCSAFFEIDFLHERSEPMDATVLNSAWSLEMFLKVQQPKLYETLIRIEPAVPKSILFPEIVSVDEALRDFFDGGFY